jgi:hypothetical protein
LKNHNLNIPGRPRERHPSTSSSAESITFAAGFSSFRIRLGPFLSPGPRPIFVVVGLCLRAQHKELSSCFAFFISLKTMEQQLSHVQSIFRAVFRFHDLLLAETKKNFQRIERNYNNEKTKKKKIRI